MTHPPDLPPGAAHEATLRALAEKSTVTAPSLREAATAGADALRRLALGDAEIERLKEALRPFVEFHRGGEGWKRSIYSGRPDAHILFDDETGASVTLRHFQNAAAALSEGGRR